MKDPEVNGYDEEMKKYVLDHKIKVKESMSMTIPQTQINREDPSQSFYKIYERHLRSSLMLKHGYKIAVLELEQEDLARFCLSLLQSEALFPMKVLTKKEPTVQSTAEPSVDPKHRKNEIWLETQIQVSRMTHNQEETIFQNTVYEFFLWLSREIKIFFTKRVGWEKMLAIDYMDKIVIEDFQKQVVDTSNKKFEKLFN